MGASLSHWLPPRIWLRIIGTAVQKKRDIIASGTGMPGAQIPRRLRPSFLLEPLEQRLVMSGGWDVALIDSTLQHEDLLTRAMLSGGHAIAYDRRHDSAADVLGKVSQWAEGNGAKNGSLSPSSPPSAGRFALGHDPVPQDIP